MLSMSLTIEDYNLRIICQNHPNDYYFHFTNGNLCWNPNISCKLYINFMDKFYVIDSLESLKKARQEINEIRMAHSLSLVGL